MSSGAVHFGLHMLICVVIADCVCAVVEAGRDATYLVVMLAGLGLTGTCT